MRRLFFRIHFVVLTAVGLPLLVGPCFAQARPKPDAPVAGADESLRAYLQTVDDDKTTRYAAAWADLNGDGVREAIIYLISNDWCGSGGCTMLILTRNAGAWNTLTRVTITRPPIRVLAAKSHGWHDLGVWVEGGGIQPGYESVLRFDGKSYPSNPSVPSSEAMIEKTAGEVAIPESYSAVPLYPSRQVAAVSSASSTPPPSFDCAKASTSTEKLICRDADLASMDAAMAAAYRELLQKAPADQQVKVRREQSEWFAKYSRACNPVPAEERKACVVRYLSGLWSGAAIKCNGGRGIAPAPGSVNRRAEDDRG